MPEGHEEISWASGWQPLLFQSEVAVPPPPEATVHEDVDLGWGTLGGRDRKWLMPVLRRPLGEATPGIVPFDIGEAPPGCDTFVEYHRYLRRLSRMRALLDLVIDRPAT
jgi:hypothetical protein